MVLSTNDSFTSPATQEAAVADNNWKAILWREAPCPPFRSDQVYICTGAVAINPSDTKMRGEFVAPFKILGADYAETVIAVGSVVKNVEFGDRICGAQHSMYAKMRDSIALK